MITFYFIIYCYSILEKKYIHDEYIFGKEESSSNGANFFYFIGEIAFFSQIIYHAGWVLNKTGQIKARFNEVYVLPDYQIDDDLNLMTIFPYINLGMIILFTFISAKFSGFSVKGCILLNFNENVGFFDDNEIFYDYFFIGCGCYIDIYKTDKNLRPLSTESDL